MKILHVIDSISSLNGGPTRSLAEMVKFQDQSAEVTNVYIYTNKSNSDISFRGTKKLRIIYSENRFHFQSIPLLLDLEPDIIHLHGIWQFIIFKMIYVANKLKIPYVISIRGMLEPWSLSVNKLKKSIALFMYQKKQLRHASFLHATSETEAQNINKIISSTKIIVIPNAVNLDSFMNVANRRNNSFLFVSRIHPKKGLELLIEAVVQLKDENFEVWPIDIYGDGEEQYVKSLHNYIKVKNLTESIIFHGQVADSEKYFVYNNAKYFILPTYSENFGNVILESLMTGTPVITTKGTPWLNLNQLNCGWCIDLSVENVKTAIKDAISKSDDDYFLMSNNAKEYVSSNFKSEVIGKAMIQAYTDAINS